MSESEAARCFPFIPMLALWSWSIQRPDVCLVALLLPFACGGSNSR